MESLPPPVGIITHNSFASTQAPAVANILTSGPFTYTDSTILTTPLKTGAMYYTNTFGELLGGSSYYGHRGSGGVCADGSTLMAEQDSFVGIGQSDNTVLVKN